MKCIGGPMDGAEVSRHYLSPSGHFRSGVSERKIVAAGENLSYWTWDEVCPLCTVTYRADGDVLRYVGMTEIVT